MTRRRRRKEDIRRRVANPKTANVRCGVTGCKQPTTAAIGQGLNRLYCRRHVDHYRRHGSYHRPSYTAAELKPYRRAALAWLKERQSDPAVVKAVAGIERLYRSAGPHVEAFRLAGKKPEERARAAWARLREAKVDPMLPVAAWLAVDMCLLDDPQADRSDEYRRVQVAKLVHRMASGSHKRWEQERPDGRIKVVELHKYPASRGLVLRVIGAKIAKICERLNAQ